jgi:hypothetical protein
MFCAGRVSATGRGHGREDASVRMQVATTLTTEESSGEFLAGRGERLVDGSGKLVGVARVPRTGDRLIDTFLMLPTDAFALLSAKFELV